MKERLFTPGPTPVPEEARLAEAKEPIHHRTSRFEKIFSHLKEDLKYVFQTEEEVIPLASSGTGAMEAAVVNLLSPGDKVLVVVGGKFGERWAEICSSFGIEVISLNIEWGNAPSPSLIQEFLEKEKDIKAVFLQLVETSTGTRYDVESIAKICSSTPSLLVVDAISGLGGEPLYTDRWKVDVVVGASQKGLMVPPGLSFISLSARAWERVEEARLPRYYWDLEKARKSLEKNQTPYTPALSLLCALEESLRLIKEEGLEKVFLRHKILARATQEGVKAMGLELFSSSPSQIVTSIKVPEGVDEKALRQIMREDYGAIIAGGQGKLSGKIVRIAHLGWMDRLDILSVLSALEIALHKVGFPVEPGKGAGAGEEIFEDMEAIKILREGKN